MSRTDKDAPYWVRAEFYEPSHGYCPEQPLHTRTWQSRKVTHACDLPTVPIRNHWRHPRWQLARGHCFWEPVWDWDRRFYTRPPTRDDRHVYHHDPDRRRVRDFCTKAKQEHAGTGDVEAVEPYAFPTKLDWWD